MRTHEVTIQTPVAETIGLAISEPRPLIVPILRAGLGMLEGMTALMPSAEVGIPGHGAQRGDPRADRLRRAPARRPVEPAVLRARPHARDRRLAAVGDPVPLRPRRVRTSPPSASSVRPRVSPPSRRPSRAATSRSCSAHSTSGSTSTATSCRASATPATGSTARPAEACPNLTVCSCERDTCPHDRHRASPSAPPGLGRRRHDDAGQR